MIIEYFLYGILVGSAWLMICNQRTWRQRQSIMDRRNGSMDFWLEFSKVDYNSHMWYLMTFRDPRKLYGPTTQHCMKRELKLFDDGEKTDG